jgi:hypothetical protein
MIIDLLDRFLRWLDRPWKAFALAGLAILVALGWGGWLSRDALVDAWKMSFGNPVLKRAEVSGILKDLRAETGADIVALWSAKLSSDALYFIEGIGLHGKVWDFTPHRIPIHRERGVQTPHGYAQLLAGRTVCRVPTVDTSDGDLFERRMVDEKIAEYCLIPVPPAPNILSAILVIAWLSPPDYSSKEAALGLALDTASTMVSRWE